MNTRTVADVESWERRPAGGDLGSVVDRGFSGVLRAGDSYAFVVAGRPVGVFDYHEDPTGDPTVTPTDVDAVANPEEAFVAPHDALPLLYAMQATGGETRGRYYSNDTPLAEVDRTLQDGGFTGYVALSENVLSGDYFLVYHGGTRRAVAFVGQSRRLKTDDEAFDLACDEVGIYTVERASLPRLSFPDDVTASSAAGAGAGGGGTGAGAGAVGAVETDDAHDPAETGDSPDAADTPTPTGAAVDADPTETATAEASTPEDGGVSAAEASSSSTSDIDIDITPRSRQQAEEEAAEEDRTASASAASPERPSSGTAAEDGPTEAGAADTADDPDPNIPRDAPVGTSAEVDDPPDEASDDAAATEPDTATAAADAEAAPDDAPPAIVRVAESDDSPEAGEGEASQEDVAAATAAVDAEEERGPEAGEPVDATDESAVDPDHVVPSVDPDRTARSQADPTGNGSGAADASAGGADASGVAEATDETVERSVDTVIDGDTVAGLRSELADREATVEDLRERLAAAETENEELREQVAALERRLEAAGAAPDSATETLSPAEALAGTSLFVRYRSKRDPTLEDVREGADPGAVAENLRLEHHTQFDAEAVSVDGQAFDPFLTSTQGHAFVEWLVTALPYEIRDTGNADSLGGLYEALPALDRIEFDGEVDAGEAAVTFDLVGRDRMGQPLFVANLEDVRDPTDEHTLGALVNDATAVAERHETLAGSFGVTSAYFEPAALETANEATSGSLLSRSKRKSFVKLSRNQGFHLCLVEDRDESFYLSVPEL
jgi:hypothetical protein